jgi:deoxynucleoside triphosphate triphosphohydrolase SAMHD1
MGLQENVESLAEEFAEFYLGDYSKNILDDSTHVAKKEINDALWGTISLTPVEVLLLDSPLIQRLRMIKQLGVVHWVYPSAVHSRFEHTLGVNFQVQNLISAINSLSLNVLHEANHLPVIDKNYTQLLRLCAILHDIGHTAFSHVSENAIIELGDMRKFCAEFAISNRLGDLKFSEIFAYFLVRSKAMKVFFNSLFDKCGNFILFDVNRQKNISMITEKISDAIVGKQINEDIPQLNELISGPFDADKLDYFSRDAYFAGIPSVIDISRLEPV